MYIDNASTTPLSQEVKDYVMSILDTYGNPSSQYRLGFQAKQIINNARNNVAKFINANPNDITFTSSGSASNTLAVKGYVQKNDCTVLYSPLCHKSILECIKSIDNVCPLDVDKEGFLNIYKLNELLTYYDNAFVVIPFADSEIGTVQHVEKIIKLVHTYGGIVYLDCTGSISTIPIDVTELSVDMLGFSGHKINALKGVGVLYKKKNIILEPLIYGSQQNGLFAGTENLLGIASIGKAVELYDYSHVTSDSRDYVWQYIKENISDCYLVGSKTHRLQHNLYICFKGISGEALMTLLDEHSIQVSTGSACSSGSPLLSPTLLAIGMNENDINSCIRITFRGKETKKDLDYVCKTIKKCVNILRQFI